MEKGINMAEILGDDGEIDFTKVSESGDQERTLLLKAPPRSRRRELIAKGAKEIRCVCCNQIRPLAGAEDTSVGWVCEDCIPEFI